MAFDIKLTFPKTPPTPKDQILRRVAELKGALGAWPKWLIGGRRRVLAACTYGKSYKDVPFEFTRGYYEKGPHDFSSEMRKSSEVKLTPLFLLPLKESGLSPLQLFSKRKERIDVKQVWEYLMLDLWSRLLRYYGQSLRITLKAPVPAKIEDNILYMSFNSGSIGDRLHEDFEPRLEVDLRSGKLPLYQAFALHLGALAHVKEAEEIKHGDYQLRHILFDPGNLLDRYFYYARINNTWQHKLTSVDPFLTAPSLSVTDVEHSLRAPNTLVQQENDALLKKARIYAAGRGLKPAHFERNYRDGYDMVKPQNAVQQLVDGQYEHWGFSVDRLY